MKSLKLTWDDDRYSPFYRCGKDNPKLIRSLKNGNAPLKCEEDLYICLSELNNHFDPPIPGWDREVGESDEDLPRYIWICTAATLPDRARYDGFKMTRDEPGVEAFPEADPYWNQGNQLNHLVKEHLMKRYANGDRWAWIEYEVRP